MSVGREEEGARPGAICGREADLKVHIRMADGREESYGRWGEGVGVFHGDVEFPEAGCRV